MTGAPDGYLLEDSSGVLILEAGTAAALDGGEEAGWLNLPGVIAGAVLVAGAIASGNARAATVNHQDEIPYVTGNGVRYSQPYTQRAQVKIPVYVDESLAWLEKFAFNAGTHRDVVELKFRDFSKWVHPAIMSFARPS